MKTAKKLLAILLCMCMVMSCVGFGNASAEILDHTHIYDSENSTWAMDLELHAMCVSLHCAECEYSQTILIDENLCTKEVTQEATCSQDERATFSVAAYVVSETGWDITDTTISGSCENVRVPNTKKPHTFSEEKSSWTMDWTDNADGELVLNACCKNCDYTCREITSTFTKAVTQDATCTANERATFSGTVYLTKGNWDSTGQSASGAAEDIEVPDTMIEHTYSGEPAWDWTVDYSGATATFKCDSCDHTEDVDATVYSKVDTKADCTTDEVVTYTAMAEFEGKTYTDVQNEIKLENSALGHSYKAETTPATCTEAGYTTYTCTRCGGTYTADEVEALGHSYDAETEVATCTEDGYTTYTCTRCGNSYTDNKVDALGHSYEPTTVPATCTEAGEITYTCSRCQFKNDELTEVLPALKHSYDATTKPATCTEAGEITYTCSRCQFKNDELTEVLPALDHSYDESIEGKVQITEPTCLDAGKKIVTCARCDSTIETVLDALGHDFDDSIEENVTPALNGMISVKCSRCDVTAMRVQADDSLHFYSLDYYSETQLYKEGKIAMPAGFEDSDEWEVNYGKCGGICLSQHTDNTAPHYSFTDNDLAKHVFTDVKIEKEATCTAAPKWTGKCKNCGYEVKTPQYFTDKQMFDDTQYANASTQRQDHTFDVWIKVDEYTHKSNCSNGNPDCTAVQVEPHAFSDWEYQNDETFIKNGTEKRTCKCGYEETQEVKGTSTLRKIIGEILGASVFAAWVYTGISYLLARVFGVNDAYLSNPPAFLKKD